MDKSNTMIHTKSNHNRYCNDWYYRNRSSDVQQTIDNTDCTYLKASQLRITNIEKETYSDRKIDQSIGLMDWCKLHCNHCRD